MWSKTWVWFRVLLKCTPWVRGIFFRSSRKNKKAFFENVSYLIFFSSDSWFYDLLIIRLSLRKHLLEFIVFEEQIILPIEPILDIEYSHEINLFQPIKSIDDKESTKLQLARNFIYHCIYWNWLDS